MKHFSKLMFMAALAITMGFAAEQTAKADFVTFNTTGAFSAASPTQNLAVTNSVTFGSGLNTTTLTFTGSTGNLVNTPSNSNFGDITVTSTGTGAAVGGNFTLAFTVTSPTVTGSNTGSTTGTLMGNLSIAQSTAFLNFTNPVVRIGGFTFTISQPVTGIPLVPQTTGEGGGAIAGVTTIQGNVTGSAVPEPTTMLLLGTGLTGLAGFARRRRMK